MNTEQTYHTTAVVQQRREEAAAINATMNPAPAGKLTDEQLGEIGAKTAVSHHGVFVIAVEPSEACYIVDTRLRTTFARAVREAVEAKQAEEMAFARQKITELQQEIGRAKHSDSGYATIADQRDKALEEIARLTAELEQAHVKAVEMIKLNAKHYAELERMRWRSVEVKPTAEDASIAGYVETCHSDRGCGRYKVSAYPWEGEEVTHWRPFCPPLAPTAEEREKLECEKWVKTQPDITHESIAIAWRAWQAARGKEDK